MARKTPGSKIDRRRRKLARIRYEIGLETAADRGRGVRELALLGVRSLVIMNGGALIGLFTFLGNSPALASRAFALGVLAASIAFVFGLTTAMISVIIAYHVELQGSVAMRANATAEVMRAHDIPEPPQAELRAPSPPSGVWGIVSLALFVVGALTAVVSVLL